MIERIEEEQSWPELTRVRRAIVVVDVVESVRLMQAYEAMFGEQPHQRGGNARRSTSAAPSASR